LGDPIPSISGLAVYLNVQRRTLHEWAKDEDKVEFSNIYERLMALQEVELLRGGLTHEQVQRMQ
jgi:hypothetical protein